MSKFRVNVIMYTDGPSEMDLYEFVLPCVSLTKKKNLPSKIQLEQHYFALL